MRSEKELVEQFLSSQQNIERYHQAVQILREIRFDVILGKLGVPRTINFDNPHAIQEAAFDQAELRGWYNCLRYGVWLY